MLFLANTYEYVWLHMDTSELPCIHCTWVSNLLTWQVDKKIPGGMKLQKPEELTIIFVGNALLNSVEAEL